MMKDAANTKKFTHGRQRSGLKAIAVAALRQDRTGDGQDIAVGVRKRQPAVNRLACQSRSNLSSTKRSA
jgi:hypothetical protein